MKRSKDVVVATLSAYSDECCAAKNVAEKKRAIGIQSVHDAAAGVVWDPWTEENAPT
jgi:hypothetical protein